MIGLNIIRFLVGSYKNILTGISGHIRDWSADILQNLGELPQRWVILVYKKM